LGKRERLRPGRKEKKPGLRILKSFSRIRAWLKWLDPFTYSDIFLEKIGLRENKFFAWPFELLVAFLTAWLIYFVLGLLLGTRSPAVVVLSGSMEPTFYRGDIMVLQGLSFESIKGKEVILPDAIYGKKIHEYATTYCSINDLPELVECRYFTQKQDESTRPKYYPELGKLCIPEINKCFFIGSSKLSIQTKKICFKSTAECIEITREGDIVVYTSDMLSIPIIHRAVVKIKAADGNFVITKGDSVNNNFVDQEGGIASSAIPVANLDGKVIFMIPKLGYVKLIIMDDIPCVIINLIKYGNFSRCPLP